MKAAGRVFVTVDCADHELAAAGDPAASEEVQPGQRHSVRAVRACGRFGRFFHRQLHAGRNSARDIAIAPLPYESVGSAGA